MLPFSSKFMQPQPPLHFSSSIFSIIAVLLVFFFFVFDSGWPSSLTTPTMVFFFFFLKDVIFWHFFHVFLLSFVGNIFMSYIVYIWTLFYIYILYVKIGVELEEKKTPADENELMVDARGFVAPDNNAFGHTFRLIYLPFHLIFEQHQLLKEKRMLKFLVDCRNCMPW